MFLQFFLWRRLCCCVLYILYIELLFKSENGSYLNVRHSHQGQQFLALVIMLLGNFYQTFSEFLNILLFPWSEVNYILDISVHF